MVFDIIRAILCCCQSSDQNDDRQTYDETMHLIIPETTEAPAVTEDARLNQRRLRERLTEIVRSTEGKMVNVASQVPFNLHNRVIPKAQSHSSSRSTLDFVNPYHDHPYYSDFYSHQDIVRFRKERSKYYHGLGRLRSISPSYHGSDVDRSRTRSPSPNAERPSAARLLNIRLVGYTDTRTRGRARERTQYPTGLPGLINPESSPTTAEVVSGPTSGGGSPSPSPSPRRPVTFEPQYPDVNALILTWD